MSLVSAIGRPIGKASSLADNTIPNNTQTVAIATASGDVYIEEIVLSKDNVALAGPTNIELSTNNVYGPNTGDDPLMVAAVGVLAVQDTLVASAAAGTPMKQFVLEDTKVIYIHGDDGVGSSAGNLRYAVRGYAMAAGASLS